MSRASGRMIRASIATSRGISRLSPEALSLFFMLLPHFTSHGKMNGNAYFIKGAVCPLIKWLPLDKIEALLKEISAETQVKYWIADDELPYLQALNWKDHQDLRADRLGVDRLPNHPTVSAAD